MKFIYSLTDVVSRALFRLCYKLEVYGNDPSKCPGGAIIASNHASFYDPPILGVAWPERIHFLARQTLFKNPVFGWLIRNCNAHPVNQESSVNMSAIRMLCHLVTTGKKVVVFPEGERTWDGNFCPPKHGVAMVVNRTKCPVIPAYIHGVYDVWPRRKAFPKLVGKITCSFGDPILYEEFEHLDRKEIRKAISERIMSEIKLLADNVKAKI